jgi:LEA14-like dessication related protein
MRSQTAIRAAARTGNCLRWLSVGALFGVLAMAACGCASMLPKLAAPGLSVTRIVFGGGNMQQQQIQLGMHASNPNDRAITVRSIECHIELAGVPFAQGSTEAAFTLPARGETDFNLDVTANLSNALAVLAGGLGHSSVDYRFYGQVRLQAGLLRSIPFDQRGRVRL